MADKTFEVDIEGKTYEVDAPDEKTAWAWANQTHVQAKKERSSGAKNIVSGMVSGAADIGTTLLTPIDWAARKMGAQNVPILQDVVGFEPAERRRLVEKTMVEMGADPESFGYQAGKIGTQIAGTLGAPGAVARPFMAAERVAPVAGTVGRAIESAGFNVPQAGGRVANAALRVGGGAAAGGAAAGLVNPEEAGVGAMGGGLFGALSKPIGQAVGAVARRFTPTDTAGLGDYQRQTIERVAGELGIDVNAMPKQMGNYIAAEAEKAFKTGSGLDPVALARKAEFESIGMKPLLGQITRDPTQFAQERNLRGAGQPIQERLTEQNIRLQNIFGEPAAAVETPYAAGQRIAGTLGKQEQEMAEGVRSLYRTARESAGKDLEVPLGGLADEYMTVLDEFGDKVPSGVRNQFKKYGLEGMKQTKLFTVEEADRLLKVINDNVGADKATNTALGRLRNAVKDSVMGVDAEGGVFAPAVAAAKQRFQTLEQIPAMKAALEGVEPEKFVNKYITQGGVDDVKRLATALRKDPETFNQARAQIAEDIRRAAFGEGVAGDAAIRPEMLAKKLRELKEKLPAFFEPEEIAQYNTAMRVANYIEKHPNAAPVNTSNTLVSALMQNPLVNLAGKIPGAGAAIGTIKAATGAVKNEMATSRAMNAKVPTIKAELSEAQRRLLSKILGGAGAAAGVLGQ
jgi:hypothetical protein